MSKKHRKTFGPAKPQLHESREDRGRTLDGKTANSKVRSEGRTLAALEKRAVSRREQSAMASKTLASKRT
jgi:hypothetical protein